MNLESLEAILVAQPVTMITSLVANNEVGSIQPVAEMVAMGKSDGVPVHVDAVAALGYLPLSF